MSARTLNCRNRPNNHARAAESKGDNSIASWVQRHAALLVCIRLVKGMEENWEL